MPLSFNISTASNTCLMILFWIGHSSTVLTRSHIAVPGHKKKRSLLQAETAISAREYKNLSLTWTAPMSISWDKTFLRERKVQFTQDSLVHQYSRRSFALKTNVVTVKSCENNLYNWTMVPRGIISGLKVAWETLRITLKVKENFSACNTLENVYTSILRLYYDVLQLQTAL